MSSAVSLEPRRRPTQARSRERVERILAAARELCEVQPADSVTTSAIARRAGLSIGSLYQYFPNRHAVLAALARKLLGETDARAIEELEALHDRPWREAVDRVVEVRFAELAKRPRVTAALRSLTASAEYLAIDAESNARLVDGLARHPAIAARGTAAEQLRVARIAVEAAAAVEAYALRAESAEERAACAAEMKRLLEAYLALHIEGPAVAPVPSEPLAPGSAGPSLHEESRDSFAPR